MVEDNLRQDLPYQENFHKHCEHFHKKLEYKKPRMK